MDIISPIHRRFRIQKLLSNKISDDLFSQNVPYKDCKSPDLAPHAQIDFALMTPPTFSHSNVICLLRLNSYGYVHYNLVTHYKASYC